MDENGGSIVSGTIENINLKLKTGELSEGEAERIKHTVIGLKDLNQVKKEELNGILKRM